MMTTNWNQMTAFESFPISGEHQLDHLLPADASGDGLLWQPFEHGGATLPGLDFTFTSYSPDDVQDRIWGPESSGNTTSDEDMAWNCVWRLEDRIHSLEDELVFLRAKVAELNIQEGERDEAAGRTHLKRPSDGADHTPDGGVATSPSEGSSSNNKRRKYVRRPKPDANAPIRPFTAYVNFANDNRKRYADQGYNFTTAAKAIGMDWQRLPNDVRDIYMCTAGNAKTRYDADVLEYMKTPNYREYQRYLQQFKTRPPDPPRWRTTT